MWVLRTGTRYEGAWLGNYTILLDFFKYSNIFTIIESGVANNKDQLNSHKYILSIVIEN